MSLAITKRAPECLGDPVWIDYGFGVPVAGLVAMMKRWPIWRQGMKVKIGLGIAVTAVLLTVIVTAVSTHGWLWSVEEFRYKRMINALPTPPQWVSDTNAVYTSPDYPMAKRMYDVQSARDDIVKFFRTALPEQGWNYVGGDLSRSDPDAPVFEGNGVYAEVMRLAFQDLKDLCLEVTVKSSLIEANTAEEELVRVELWLLEMRNGSRIDPCEDYDIAH